MLEEDRCIVYEARPTICRTHGAPVQFRQENQLVRDVCPLNFTPSTPDGPLPLHELPASDLIDLDRLNMLLALTNRLTLEAAGLELEREPLREATARWLARLQ